MPYNFSARNGDQLKMKLRFPALLFLCFSFASSAFGQAYMNDIVRDSARSDKLTGGTIEKTSLADGENDLRITINVPAFQMTLWQNGKEVKSYPIGVGLLDYPIIIGRREASSIEWNPVWIPPSSDWIEKSSTVKPGEIILPTDPRNPLGKVKIPLGYGYLIHQAKGPGDMGNLVSHGCVRVMQSDLYDLAEKIVAARSLDVMPEQISAAKRSKKTLIAPLDPIISVEITYDTMVVEAGRLHIYPDVYGYKKNTVTNLKRELKTSGIDYSEISDSALAKMIAAATAKKQFVVDIASLESDNALKSGKVIPVLSTTVQPKPGPIKRKKLRR
jgi:hypothetical protein